MLSVAQTDELPRRLAPPDVASGDWESSTSCPGVLVSAVPISSSHPIVACTAEIAAALDGVASVDPGFMRTSEKAATLVALTEAASRLDELRLRVLAVSDDVAEHDGARDAGAWLAHRTRATSTTGRGEQRLAVRLTAHEPVRDALATGRLRSDQAVEIVRAVDALPTRAGADDEVTVGPELRARARAHLLDLAADHDAKNLRRLGKHLLEVISPELGEAQEARLLAAEEARAAATASFTMVDDGKGRCHGRFVIPSLAGAMLGQHLLALANPKRHDEDELKTEDGKWRSMPERLGAAFIEYVERYPSDHTPGSGGVSATVVVTMTMDALTGGLASAALNNGDKISAGEARRLACESGIIPAVLGGRSQILDLGRKARFHTQAQRVALGHRDRGCTAQGCDLPPAACHAHHDQPWSRGGSTTVTSGRLLCPRHHRIAHQTDYDTHIHADNSVTFHRRT